MLFLEMKRRLCTKYVLFSIMGILIITIGLNFIIVDDIKDITPSLQEDAVYEGDIKEENLFASLKKVRDEKSEDRRYSSQVFIISGLVNNYPGVLYTENKIEDYPDKYAKEFYQCWRNKFEVLLKRLPTKEQQTALTKLNKVKIPFAQYPGYYIYFTALDNIQILFIIILLLVTFFASETYSESFGDESMEIIKTTKGYKKNMAMRILPVIFYGIILTLIATLVTIGMISSKIGLNALKSSFKMIALFSFGSFSIGGAVIIMVLAEILGILALSTLMGYISFKSKKTTTAIILGVSLSVFYMIGSRIVSSSTNFMNYLLNAIPMASSYMLPSIASFSFDFGIWKPYAIIIEISIVFILSTTALVIAINNK
ncbi:MAG: hypothetical protein PHP06_07515 [Clostridia bacterium]|nr:hypothetical protein [Clostridia bacterium]